MHYPASVVGRIDGVVWVYKQIDFGKITVTTDNACGIVRASERTCDSSLCARLYVVYDPYIVVKN